MADTDMLTDKDIFDAIRERRGIPLLQADVDAINAILYPKKPVAASVPLPWLDAARSKIGEREIPGPQNNNWIAQGWAKLKAPWFNSDETPWCGFFVAWSLNEAGLSYPKNFASAASFRDYGTPCQAQLGAIGVKARKGGNHVFIIVGETPDKRFFKALGGNQSDCVDIMDIAKSDVDAIRWPAGAAVNSTGLPVLPAGKIVTKEV